MVRSRVVAEELARRWGRYLKTTPLDVRCDHKEIKLPEEGTWCAMGALLDLMKRAEKRKFCRECPNVVVQRKSLCPACTTTKATELLVGQSV